MDRKLLYCYMKTGHVGHPNKLLKYVRRSQNVIHERPQVEKNVFNLVIM